MPPATGTEVARVEAIVLREPGAAGEESVLVVVEAADGTRGYGEAAARPEAVVKVIESSDPDPVGWNDGVRGLVVGSDARDPAAVWRRLKEATFWSCRSGIGHVALAGVDMALWDLAGKLQGKPAWQLMGERRNRRLVPYLTAYHGPAPFEQTLRAALDAIEQAVAAGYEAVKVEALANTAPDRRHALELARRARECVGPDVALLLDVGYRWEGFEAVRDLARELDTLGLWALEAPFAPERIRDHRRLAEAIETPIASGDQLTAAVEYMPLLDSGAVSIVQAGAARTGISDMHVLAGEAADRGRGLVPWGWVPSALSVAANLHVAMVHDNVPLIEYRSPDVGPAGPLRRHLAGPEPVVRGGAFEPPAACGLGVEVDWEVVERLRV